MNLLIVSGLSGAGKSVAMNALEDIGFFCIDNIPAALLPSITAFSKAGDNMLKRVALCMDIRACRTCRQSSSSGVGEQVKHLHSRLAVRIDILPVRSLLGKDAHVLE